jgi:hypothetical protein
MGNVSSEPRGNFDGDEYIYSAAKAHIVDFPTRSVSQVELPDRVVSLGHTWKTVSDDDGLHQGRALKVLVRLPTEIRDLEGRVIPIPEAIRDQNIQVISTLGDDVVLLARYFEPSDSQLYWIDKEGQVTRHETLPREPERDFGGMEWVSGLAMPMPTVLGPTLFVIAPLSKVSNGEAPDFPTALAKSLPVVWLPALLVCVVSVIAAAATYRRQRRYSGTGAAAWAIFVLLLGVPGWIGYRLHRSWPARTRCEHCGRVVPRDRATCLACAAEFPPPAARGIEVFA